MGATVATLTCVGGGIVDVGATATGFVAAADGDGRGIGVEVVCGDEEQATKQNKVSQMAGFVMTV
jgi:hypothetical protein